LAPKKGNKVCYLVLPLLPFQNGLLTGLSGYAIHGQAGKE
jgi:hypothetical protein